MDATPLALGRILSPSLYDWPETADAVATLTHALIEALARHNIVATWNAATDTSALPHSALATSDLILAQTCGRPLVTVLAEQVQPVATPHYAVPGCFGAHYRSWLVVRADDPVMRTQDLSDRPVAVNSHCSQSGYAALAHTFATADGGPVAPGPEVLTGSHTGSMEAVANGMADAATIDAVCWALTQQHQPDLAEALTAVVPTVAVPGLPFVTAPDRSPEVLSGLRAALHDVLHDPACNTARDAIFWSGLSNLTLADYAAVSEIAAVVRQDQPGVWQLD